ncbi:MAG TPA: hypothetical protein VH877_11600 [Polyangia bacterium]|jgi:hypothetical protein|nr:hypothetical protein [Polyangia bacterium]
MALVGSIAEVLLLGLQKAHQQNRTWICAEILFLPSGDRGPMSQIKA